MSKIITSISAPAPHMVEAGDLWRKEKTGEIRAWDGKGGWATPTDAQLKAVGIVRGSTPDTKPPQVIGIAGNGQPIFEGQPCSEDDKQRLAQSKTSEQSEGEQTQRPLTEEDVAALKEKFAAAGGEGHDANGSPVK